MSNATRAAVIQNFSLGTMGVNSMGTKYKSMREEQLLYQINWITKLSGDNFCTFQMEELAKVRKQIEELKWK